MRILRFAALRIGGESPRFRLRDFSKVRAQSCSRRGDLATAWYTNGRTTLSPNRDSGVQRRSRILEIRPIRYMHFQMQQFA